MNGKKSKQVLRVCLVRMRENKKKWMVDHLNQKNEKWVRGPITNGCFLLWYLIYNPFNYLSNLTEIKISEGFEVTPLISFFPFSLIPNNYECQIPFTTTNLLLSLFSPIKHTKKDRKK